MSNLKLVQVKMSEDTLSQIEYVKNRLHADTVTGTIKSSIADMITKAMSRGDNVIIQKPNGEKYIMTMPGISNHG